MFFIHKPDEDRWFIRLPSPGKRVAGLDVCMSSSCGGAPPLVLRKFSSWLFTPPPSPVSLGFVWWSLDFSLHALKSDVL